MVQNIRICRTVAGLRHIVALLKSQGKTVGFVPTMGALHEGHASLFNRARSKCDVLIASIYANPTQFDNLTDLEKYPKTEKEDLMLLQREKTDIAFIPQTDDIYHQVKITPINYGVLTESLEGAHRPGHFDGMTTIVRRLFEIVTPDLAFFGEKDWQQLAITRHMTELEQLKIQIIGCPIVRESDGLAMSSRNRRMTTEERSNALKISEIILNASHHQSDATIRSREDTITKTLIDSKLRPNYVKIVNADTLKEVLSIKNSGPNRILIAAFSGNTRLIDNGAL